MAYEIDGPTFGTITAAADYTSSQYFCGVIDGLGTFTRGSVIGARADAVLQNDPNTGETALLRFEGITKVRYGGTVTVGDELIMAASGEVVSMGNTPGNVLGVALQSGVDNDIGTMMFKRRSNVMAPIGFYVDLNLITAADLITDWIPGFHGRIYNTSFVTGTIVSTGAGATMALTTEIGSTAVTSQTMTVTLASTSAIGEVTTGTAGTAAYTFTPTSTVSVIAGTVTDFTAGHGTLFIHTISL